MIEATGWFWFWVIYFGGLAALVAGAIWTEHGCQRLDAARDKFDAALIKVLNEED